MVSCLPCLPCLKISGYLLSNDTNWWDYNLQNDHSLVTECFLCLATTKRAISYNPAVVEIDTDIAPPEKVWES